MKTRHQSELTPGVAARRNLGVRTVVASRPVTTEDPDAIRPFHVKVPEAELTALRRRINATKWPEGETVPEALEQPQPQLFAGELRPAFRPVSYIAKN